MLSPVGSILAELNDEQRQAVLHGDEPLLVIAGAGTGKTATLAHRVAYKITNGTNPGRILLLTFTRRAAAEMLRRVDGIRAPCRRRVRSGEARSTQRPLACSAFMAAASG
jgi:superfamily I DNA/RNA helicase